MTRNKTYAYITLLLGIICVLISGDWRFVTLSIIFGTVFYFAR